MISRRTFIQSASLSLAWLVMPFKSYSFPKSALRFGWVSDIHYALAPVKWGRHYSDSLKKLSEAVQLFCAQGVDLVVQSGDLIDMAPDDSQDKVLTYLISANQLIQNVGVPVVHVAGNHDFDCLSKAQFISAAMPGVPNMDHMFSWFDRDGFRFVILDACFTREGKSYTHGNYTYDDTSVPAFEMEWLKCTLSSSPGPVLVFIHQQIDGQGCLYVRNSDEVRSLLEDSGKVMAVFQGHMHEGGYNQIQGIHYFTQKSVVDGAWPDDNSYSIVELDSTGIRILGFRNALSGRVTDCRPRRFQSARTEESLL